MKSRHWYHCTTDDLGQRFAVCRQQLRCRSDREPLTPRLCACHTVAGCFAARLFDPGKPVLVYRTEQPRRGIMPVGVWDQCVTGERWLIPPTMMRLEKVIDAGTVDEAQGSIRIYHRLTRRNSSLRLRVAQLAAAVKVLGGPTERVRDMTRLLGLTGDMDQYILEKADEFLVQSCPA